MSTLRFPSDIANSNAYMALTIQEFKSFDTTSLTSASAFKYNANSISTVALPVPKDLQISGDVTWNGLDDLTSNVANKVAGKAGQSVKYISTELGATTNKPTQMTFDSVRPRTFNYIWNLIPRNATEAAAIENIIYQLDYAKLPDAAIAGVSAKFPNMIKIRLVSGNRIIKYLPCVITVLNTNFSPGGDYREYHDGYLPAYTLSISFVEIASLNKQVYRRMLGR